MNLREHRLIGIAPAENMAGKAFGDGAVKSRLGAEVDFALKGATYRVGHPDNGLLEDGVQVGINGARTAALSILGLGNAVVGALTGEKARSVSAKGGADNTLNAVGGGFKRMSEGTLGGVVGGAYKVVFDGVDGVLRDGLGSPEAIETN